MDEAPAPDQRRIRAGLALVGVVTLVALVLLLVVDDPVGRFVMAVVAATSMVRMFLLSRRLRRDATG